VHVTVDWHEQNKALKLCFPINISDAVATYEIPYGTIIRPLDGTEEPGQSWVDLSGINSDTKAPYGFSILNDGKYSFSIEGSEMRLTVLRSPIYAHHKPYKPDPKSTYTFIDQGSQQFSYTLLPHSGTWKDSNTVQHAAELNQPAFSLKDTHHPWGKLPHRNTFLSAAPANIVISAVKLAEDNDDLILRCIETQNMLTKAKITMYNLSEPITVDFTPGEIKTLRIPANRSSPITEVNLLECES
jgi:alpha-mannosidase